jgi:hypothetical protein
MLLVAVLFLLLCLNIYNSLFVLKISSGSLQLQNLPFSSEVARKLGGHANTLVATSTGTMLPVQGDVTVVQVHPFAGAETRRVLGVGGRGASDQAAGGALAVVHARPLAAYAVTRDVGQGNRDGSEYVLTLLMELAQPRSSQIRPSLSPPPSQT